MFTSRTLVLAVLLLAALAAAAPAVAGVGKAILPLDFLHVLGFEKHCLARFSALDFFSDSACLSSSISKALGFGVIAGACVVKVPQILKIVAKGSVEGISKSACYLELIGYLLQSIWHIHHNGSPFSAYGETVIVSVQSAAIILFLWRYKYPGTSEVLGAVAAFAATAYASFALGGDLVQNASTALFGASRLGQIIVNFKQGHTGELAFMTLFMQFAGCAARIFTTIKEVRQPVAIVSVLVAAALNGILVLQALFMGSASAAAAKERKRK